MKALLCVVLLVFAPGVRAEDAGRPHSDFRPYNPEIRDYGIELGGSYESLGLYWLGGLLGFRTGECWLMGSEQCHQYIDLIAGAAGRDGLNLSFYHASIRHQFVKPGDPWSFFGRVLAGTIQVRGQGRHAYYGSAGIGLGSRVSFHERVDFVAELRLGVADQAWAQGLVGLQFNLDSWVDYFGNRLKALGEGTIEASGDILKHTIQAPVKVMDFVAPKSKAKPEEVQPENKPAVAPPGESQ